MTDRYHTNTAPKADRSHIRALIIPEDSSQPMYFEHIDPDGKGIAELLNARLIQAIYGPLWTSWVDESGAMLQRPMNVRATTLVRHLQKEHNLIADRAPLHGPVMFCGNESPGGQQTDVPFEVLLTADVIHALVRESQPS